MTARNTLEGFMVKAIAKHGKKYNYKDVVYKNIDTHVVIYCNVHGKFLQTPYMHLRSGGCKKCGYANRNNNNSTTAKFIAQARLKHNDKYDYSKVVYVSSKLPVIIICPHHGEFPQIPNSHLTGRGCQECGFERSADACRMTLTTFIKRSREAHNKEYTYEKVVYLNNTTKVEITCPKHGSFWQEPQNHLNGSRCPCCVAGKTQRLLWNYVCELFPNNKVEYNFKHPNLIFKKSGYSMELDIFLPELNLAIEYQGKQHFGIHPLFNDDSILERDKEKRIACENAGIKLIEIDYTWDKSMEQVVSILK